MTKQEINSLTIKWLMDTYKINVDSNLLYTIAEKGNVDLCQAILECGINPNIVENNDDSALHVAASEGHKEMVKLLLRFGANPNYLPYEDEVYYTPFDYAIHQGNLEIVKMMIEAGADVNHKVSGNFVWEEKYAYNGGFEGKEFDAAVAYVKKVAERQNKK